jgi:hypothetical protein
MSCGVHHQHHFVVGGLCSSLGFPIFHHLFDPSSINLGNGYLQTDLEHTDFYKGLDESLVQILHKKAARIQPNIVSTAYRS